MRFLYQQALDVGSMVLLRNSQRDGRKGGSSVGLDRTKFKSQLAKVFTSY